MKTLIVLSIFWISSLSISILFLQGCDDCGEFKSNRIVDVEYLIVDSLQNSLLNKDTVHWDNIWIELTVINEISFDKKSSFNLIYACAPPLVPKIDFVRVESNGVYSGQNKVFDVERFQEIKPLEEAIPLNANDTYKLFLNQPPREEGRCKFSLEFIPNVGNAILLEFEKYFLI